MNHHKGKTFLANAKLFRTDKSLYFPNLQGYTLANDNDGGDGPRAVRDTTPVLRGHISLVSVFSGTWALRQTRTFVDDARVLASLGSPLASPSRDGGGNRPEGGGGGERKGEGGGAGGGGGGGGGGDWQKVEINIEEDWMKALLIRMSLGGMRKAMAGGPAAWARYFVVRKGVSEQVRHDLGIANGKVGYVYLVDGECRIRWAGCANAEEKEVEALVAGLRRLVAKMVREREREGEGEGEKDAVEITTATTTTITAGAGDGAAAATAAAAGGAAGRVAGAGSGS